MYVFASGWQVLWKLISVVLSEQVGVQLMLLIYAQVSRPTRTIRLQGISF